MSTTSDHLENLGPTAALPAPSLRSYVLRTGRMGSGQRRALLELAPKWVAPYQSSFITPETLYTRVAPLVLEIGFGMGEATAQIAASLPDIDFLGVEVHPPGVGALLRRIDEQGLTNLRIVQHNAVEVVAQMLAPCSLFGVHIFFPDPWHKKKHNKRRLIQAPFIQLLQSRLQPGGYLHCATDWQPYAEQMLEVLTASSALRNTTNGFAEKPSYRPLTKFEQRGLTLGHGVWDVVFQKQ